jgi:transposase-like protein
VVDEPPECAALRQYVYERAMQAIQRKMHASFRNLRVRVRSSPAPVFLRAPQNDSEDQANKASAA